MTTSHCLSLRAMSRAARCEPSDWYSRHSSVSSCQNGGEREHDRNRARWAAGLFAFSESTRVCTCIRDRSTALMIGTYIMHDTFAILLK